MNKYKPLTTVHFTILSTRAFEMLINTLERCSEDVDPEEGCSRCSRRDKCIQVWDYIVDHTTVVEEEEAIDGVEPRREELDGDLGTENQEAIEVCKRARSRRCSSGTNDSTD